MPAYRSSAEGEIRDAVVARIRLNRPNARIIHEINCSSFGPNRIDLIAVDRAEIIAVEIKSQKDKLDRLEAQVKSMRKVSTHVISALHEKFLTYHPGNEQSSYIVKDGQHLYGREPEQSRMSLAWIYPEKHRAVGNWDSLAKWQFPKQALDCPLPSGALDLLWREELYNLCAGLRVSATRKSTMGEMTRDLRWHCTSKELTLGICRVLRARTCVEADDPIYEGKEKS